MYVRMYVCILLNTSVESFKFTRPG